MKFSQKETCKNCFIEGERRCGVNIDVNPFRVDTPLEPCFKPITQNDFKGFSFSVQKADLEIFRATQK